MIVADFWSDVQHYQREFSKTAFPRPKSCPKCAAADRLIGHGSYPRSVCDHIRMVAIRVKRLLCTACRHTVSLLPSFCLPYRRYLADTIEPVLALRFQKSVSWTAIRAHFDPSELPVLSTCREWVAAFGRNSGSYLAHLLRQLADWQIAPGRLELLIADLAAMPKGPAQLLAAVPHLVAWLRDKGIPLNEGGGNWLRILWRWGHAAKLGRLL